MKMTPAVLLMTASTLLWGCAAEEDLGTMDPGGAAHRNQGESANVETDDDVTEDNLQALFEDLIQPSEDPAPEYIAAIEKPIQWVACIASMAYCVGDSMETAALCLPAPLSPPCVAAALKTGAACMAAEIACLAKFDTTEFDNTEVVKMSMNTAGDHATNLKNTANAMGDKGATKIERQLHNKRAGSAIKFLNAVKKTHNNQVDATIDFNLKLGMDRSNPDRK